MKLFVTKSTQPLLIDDAVEMGWDDTSLGYNVLESLEVGECCYDDDEITWERVQ